MFLLKEVKYRTTMFALVEEDTIINAILLLKDGIRGLIYHPHTRGECPSIEIVQLGKDDCWESITEEAFVNINHNFKKFDQFIFNENKVEFRRKIIEPGDRSSIG